MHAGSIPATTSIKVKFVALASQKGECYNLSMTNYIRRLIYVDAAETTKVNPLFYAFMFGTLMYGLGFVFFGFTEGVSSSSLYKSLFMLHEWLPRVWGLGALVAGILSFYCILTRQTHYISPFTSMLGVMVWLFAAFCYLQTGAWLLVLTITIPYGYFWVYWYFRLKWYLRLKDAGQMVDAG